MSKKIYPKISVSSLIQRANDLVVVCRHDLYELKLAGMDCNLVEQVALLLKECADVEAQWQLAKESNALARTRHRRYLRECRKLRSRLAENIRLAFKNADVKINLPGMHANFASAELVQDLNDLSSLCIQNRELLEKTNFNFELANTAATRAKELADAVAVLKIECEKVSSKYFSQRDVIYNELYSKVKEICRFGRVAFFDNPLRKKSYYAIR